MRVRFGLIIAFVCFAVIAANAQTQRPTPEPTRTATPPEHEPPPSEQDVDRFKIDTSLVTIPVIASNASGQYVPDLNKADFLVLEDGDRQEIAFFATVNAPFHVVLLLDTSASTQKTLRYIQEAAIAFVEQLQGADRVKVISFDDQVHDLNDFTGDKALLQATIRRTKPGDNTKLYDAMQDALAALYAIKGRRAIVLFSDGVDHHSDRAEFDDALRALDESGIIVYPIRYDTRAQTERLVREASGAQLPTIGVIQGTRKETPTPSTFPSEDRLPIPSLPDPAPEGTTRLPPPSILLGGRRPIGSDPRTTPPDDTGLPDSRDRTSRDRTSRDRTSTRDQGPSRESGADDSISHMLDMLYVKADSYLLELATRSGGRIARADTLASLPEAFKNIAAELRTQYSLGYYSANKAHDGRYRKVQVKTTRKDVSVRAKPGYRVRSGG